MPGQAPIVRGAPPTAETLRDDFPILARQVNGKPLIYLDNAATTQKPQCVIDAISEYYTSYNANVHRAAHALADQATQALENARETAAQFLNAADTAEVVFTRGTTESINLVAQGLSHLFSPGDEILISTLEHHSNIVPWQQLAKRSGAQLTVVDVLASGDLDLDDFHRKLSARTKLVALAHVSNALGTVHPLQELIAAAHAVNAWFVVDGAQATAHQPIDVQALQADFYAFSGHKCFGPTGIGILYGKREVLELLEPMLTGGEMIEQVSFQGTTFNRLPYRLEAGTPNIAGAIGLGCALSYLQQLPVADLAAAEEETVRWTIAQLKQIPGLRLVGEPRQRQSVVSFLADAGAPDDLGTLLDQQGVAVRTGHHCAMPFMERWDLPGTVRASFRSVQYPCRCGSLRRRGQQSDDLSLGLPGCRLAKL